MLPLVAPVSLRAALVFVGFHAETRVDSVASAIVSAANVMRSATSLGCETMAA